MDITRVKNDNNEETKILLKLREKFPRLCVSTSVYNDIGIGYIKFKSLSGSVRIIDYRRDGPTLHEYTVNGTIKLTNAYKGAFIYDRTDPNTVRTALEELIDEAGWKGKDIYLFDTSSFRDKYFTSQNKLKEWATEAYSSTKKWGDSYFMSPRMESILKMIGSQERFKNVIALLDLRNWTLTVDKEKDHSVFEFDDPLYIENDPNLEEMYFKMLRQNKRPCLIIKSDIELQEEELLRDINIIYTDSNNIKHAFGTYKSLLMQFPLLRNFIRNNPSQNIEFPQGECLKDIIDVLLDADGFKMFNLNTMNIKQTLHHLCALNYLKGDTYLAEKHLAQLLNDQEDPLLDLLYNEHIFNFLIKNGLRFYLEF